MAESDKEVEILDGAWPCPKCGGKGWSRVGNDYLLPCQMCDARGYVTMVEML